MSIPLKYNNKFSLYHDDEPCTRGNLKTVSRTDRVRVQVQVQPAGKDSALCRLYYCVWCWCCCHRIKSRIWGEIWEIWEIREIREIWQIDEIPSCKLTNIHCRSTFWQFPAVRVQRPEIPESIQIQRLSFAKSFSWSFEIVVVFYAG
jgi:hypothetical protein